MSDRAARAGSLPASEREAFEAKLQAQEAELLRTWFVLKEFGLHPGRTDDRLADVVRAALGGAQVEAPQPQRAEADHIVRMVLEDMEICAGESPHPDWESQELSTETVEALIAYERAARFDPAAEQSALQHQSVAPSHQKMCRDTALSHIGTVAAAKDGQGDPSIRLSDAHSAEVRATFERLSQMDTREPIGFITEESRAKLLDEEWCARRDEHVMLWSTDGPPSRAIIPLYLHPAASPIGVGEQKSQGGSGSLHARSDGGAAT